MNLSQLMVFGAALLVVALAGRVGAQIPASD